jgi:hypothetical protein
MVTMARPIRTPRPFRYGLDSAYANVVVSAIAITVASTV